MATEYGSRLTQARKHGRLTQSALAKKVGVGQSTISELEKIGHGSAYSHQIAVACGVNPQWLATGEGQMLGAESSAHKVEQERAAYNTIDSLLGNLGELLEQHSPTRRRSCGDMLARFASEPDNLELREELKLLLETPTVANQRRRA